MDRYQIKNAAFAIKGYYRPPSASDHTKATVEERFEDAKKEALFHLQQRMNDIKSLTIEQCFPNYRKDT